MAHVTPASSSRVVTSCQSRSFLTPFFVLWHYTMPLKQIWARFLSQACNKRFILYLETGMHSCCTRNTEITNCLKNTSLHIIAEHQLLHCPWNQQPHLKCRQYSYTLSVSTCSTWKCTFCILKSTGIHQKMPEQLQLPVATLHSMDVRNHSDGTTDTCASYLQLGTKMSEDDVPKCLPAISY